jgi:hypothetical protein
MEKAVPSSNPLSVDLFAMSSVTMIIGLREMNAATIGR